MPTSCAIASAAVNLGRAKTYERVALQVAFSAVAVDRERGLRLLATEGRLSMPDVQLSEVAEDKAFQATVAELAADGEGGLEMLARQVEAALLGVNDGEAVQHQGFGAPIAALAADRERSLQGRARFVHRPGLALDDAEFGEGAGVGLAQGAAQHKSPFGAAPRLGHAALLPLGIGKACQHLGLPGRIDCRLREGERSREQHARVLEPARSHVRACRRVQRCGAQRRLDRRDRVDFGAEADRDIERSLRAECRRGSAQGADRDPSVPSGDGTPARGDQVVELASQYPPPSAATAATERPQVFVGAEAREIVAVPLLDRAPTRRAARRQLLRSVVVDAQVHPEVRLLDVMTGLLSLQPRTQQALVDENLHCVQDRRRVGPRREVDHRFGGVEHEAAVEDRALGER